MSIDGDTATVVDRLNHLADRVTPPPDLLGGARRRARHRRHRRQVITAGVALLALVGGGVAVQARPWAGRADHVAPTAARTARSLLDQPTRGDLAGSPGYLAQVGTAWLAALPANRPKGSTATNRQDLRGKPHVVWAGNTPSGAAAIVVQEFDVPRLDVPAGATVPTDMFGPHLAIGYLGPGRNGAPTVLDSTQAPFTQPALFGFFLGAQRSTLVLLDPDAPVNYSLGFRYRQDGTVDRGWRVATPRDGATVLTVPGGTDQRAIVAVLADTPSPSEFSERPGEFVLANHADASTLPSINGGHTYSRLEWNQSQWALPDRTAAEKAWHLTLAPNPTSEQVRALWNKATGGRYTDPYTDGAAFSQWFAVGVTPDGHRFVVGDRQLGHQPSQLYGAWQDAHGGLSTLYGGPVTPGAALPVRLRLPGGQGWVVAAKGAQLSWHGTGGTAWTDAGTDAALLPTAATQVRVTVNGHSTDVTLAS